jgi:septation ring formation regulator EzrA
MDGGPPYWPDDGSNGELMEPDEDEQDPAVERDLEELGATVEKYGEFLPELLDKLERELATDALSLWAGFVAFCEESMGVPPESVVAVVLEPVADRIEDLKDRAERLELEATSETVEEIREGLAESWRVVEERGV